MHAPQHVHMYAVTMVRIASAVLCGVNMLMLLIIRVYPLTASREHAAVVWSEDAAASLRKSTMSFCRGSTGHCPWCDITRDLQHA